MPSKNIKQTRQANVKKVKKTKSSAEPKHSSQKSIQGACNSLEENLSVFVKQNDTNKGMLQNKNGSQKVKKENKVKQHRKRAPSKCHNVDKNSASINKADKSSTVACASRRQQPCFKEKVVVYEDKYPLFCNWELYYLHYDSKKRWHDCCKKLASVKTVEQFWRLNNYILVCFLSLL